MLAWDVAGDGELTLTLGSGAAGPGALGLLQHRQAILQMPAALGLSVDDDRLAVLGGTHLCYGSHGDWQDVRREVIRVEDELLASDEDSHYRPGSGEG